MLELISSTIVSYIWDEWYSIWSNCYLCNMLNYIVYEPFNVWDRCSLTFTESMTQMVMTKTYQITLRRAELFTKLVIPLTMLRVSMTYEHQPLEQYGRCAYLQQMFVRLLQIEYVKRLLVPLGLNILVMASISSKISCLSWNFLCISILSELSHD